MGINIKRRENEYFNPIGGSGGDHDFYQNSRRELVRSCCNRLDWSWRLAISVSLTFAMMLIYLIGEASHFDKIRTISSIFNSTGRIEQVLVATESIQRSFFLDKTKYILSTDCLDSLQEYQSLSHEAISLVYSVQKYKYQYVEFSDFA